jgi:tetratricopeptide (TPR) repeat protein
MQVLVALVRARGAIMSRDELIASCWDGRIVGEDAINRVMSRLRRLAETLGAGVFHVETLTKVGYRLVQEVGVLYTPAEPVRDATAEEPALAATVAAAQELPLRGARGGTRFGRRTVLGGLAATGVAAVTPMAWTWLSELNRRWGGHVPKPEAERFYEAGMQAQYFGVADTSEQAVAYFRQAAAIDPDWADAWGSLAMSYRHILDGETNSEQLQLVEMTRSAARRALELDPNNAEALVALTLIPSPFRRWAEAEREYRPMVDRFPRAFVMRGHLGRLMGDVGRWGEACAAGKIASGENPLVSVASASYARSLWCARRLQEAETEIERGIRTWPKHFVVWFNKMTFLTYSGRPAEAIAFASNRDGWPAAMPDFLFERRITEARAVATRGPADIAAALTSYDQMIQRSLSQVPFVLPAENVVGFFATIGEFDRAFDVLQSFFFDRGRYAPPVRRSFGPLTRRSSSMLFMPNVSNLWSEPRFSRLLQELGLEDYWRQVGTQPDYRNRPN